MGPLNAECFPAGLRFQERRDAVRTVLGHGAVQRAQAGTFLLQDCALKRWRVRSAVNRSCSAQPVLLCQRCLRLQV